MTKSEAFRNWVLVTWKMIQSMLTLAGIPYTIDFYRNYDDHAFRIKPIKWIRFPWRNECDVAIGNLHINDTEVQLDGKTVIRHPYPSIETMGFSWDENDVTVFDSPEEFLVKISGEYGRHLVQSAKKNKETHTTWESNKSLDSKPNDTWGSNASI